MASNHHHLVQSKPHKRSTMDDLSALKEHLDEQATPNFAGLFVARLEQTESDNETLALLESFWEVLDGEGGADRSMREFRMVRVACRPPGPGGHSRWRRQTLRDRRVLT